MCIRDRPSTPALLVVPRRSRFLHAAAPARVVVRARRRTFAPGDAAAPTRITAIVVIAVLASDRYPPPLDAPSPACNLRGMETDARGCASGLLANPKGRTARPAEGRPPALVSARCDARRAPRESVRRAHPRDRRLGARRRCSTALVAVTTTTGRYLARESRIILHLGREKATSPRICGCQFDCSSYGRK